MDTNEDPVRHTHPPLPTFGKAATVKSYTDSYALRQERLEELERYAMELWASDVSLIDIRHWLMAKCRLTFALRKTTAKDMVEVAMQYVHLELQSLRTYK